MLLQWTEGQVNLQYAAMKSKRKQTTKLLVGNVCMILISILN